MKQELQSLRIAMSQQILVDQSSPVKQRAMAGTLDFLASTSTQGGQDSGIVDEDFPVFPVASINRVSTPLPRPDQPEAARLFGGPTGFESTSMTLPQQGLPVSELPAPRAAARQARNFFTLPPAIDTGLPMTHQLQSQQSAAEGQESFMVSFNLKFATEPLTLSQLPPTSGTTAQGFLDARSPTFVPQVPVVSGPAGMSLWQSTTSVEQDPTYYNDDRSRHSSADFGLNDETEGQWMALVDRVIAHFDQHASVQLQQRLKSSPPELRAVICEAIHRRLVHLMSESYPNTTYFD